MHGIAASLQQLSSLSRHFGIVIDAEKRLMSTGTSPDAKRDIVSGVGGVVYSCHLIFNGYAGFTDVSPFRAATWARRVAWLVTQTPEPRRCSNRQQSFPPTGKTCDWITRLRASNHGTRHL